MKKIITMLSALTITSSITPLVVACGKEENKTSIKTNDATKNKEEKGLDLASLNANSFKVLQNYEINEEGTLSTIKNTKIEEVKDAEMKLAIKNHLRVMLLQKVFNVKNFNPDPEKDLIWYMLSELFLGTPTTEPMLKITVTASTDTKKYEIKIVKTKWDSIKSNAQNLITEISTGHGFETIKKEVSVENLKSYYALIKGEEVTITIDLNK